MLESLILEISYYIHNKRSIFLLCTGFVRLVIKSFFSSFPCNLVFFIVFSQVYNSQSHTGYYLQHNLLYPIRLYVTHVDIKGKQARNDPCGTQY